MTSCGLGTMRPVAWSIRMAFMSGTCLMSTAMVSGPALAITCGDSPLNAHIPCAACVRAEKRQTQRGIIPVAQAQPTAGSAGETLSEREVNVQRQLQSQAQSGIVEVIAGDVANPIESVEHGVAMHAEPLRRFLRTSVCREERVQGADQIGIVLPIIGKQFAKRLRVEVAQLRQPFGSEDQSVDAKIAKQR